MNFNRYKIGMWLQIFGSVGVVSGLCFVFYGMRYNSVLFKKRVCSSCLDPPSHHDTLD